MAKRQPISAKLRFEVFKRDSFTCQYCGAKAPDVILHVDHINPVSKGGDNDILNLLTACAKCNGGKSDRLLTDNAEIEKQRGQLEELNERRQQLEWMVKWREELVAFKEDVAARVIDYWESRLPGHDVTPTGSALIVKWLRSHTAEVLLDAIDKAIDRYAMPAKDGSGVVSGESANQAFNMVPRIAASAKRDAEKPWLKDCYYVRGILRNRLPYINEIQAAQLSENAILAGADPEWVKETAKRVGSWTQFADAMLNAIAELRAS